MNPPTIGYAFAAEPRPKPTRHSGFAIASLAVFLLGLAYEGTITALAHHGSYTYPWERFNRNVGDPEFFKRIPHWIGLLGISLAIAGIVHPNRKRWAAPLLALCNVLLTVDELWPLHRAS